MVKSKYCSSRSSEFGHHDPIIQFTSDVAQTFLFKFGGLGTCYEFFFYGDGFYSQDVSMEDM